MPSSPTHPSVYIQESPDEPRAIAGVPTSIAAFVGRVADGPVNEPVLVTTYVEFEQQFGGLNAELPLTYAVRDFFANGGDRALIVRLVNGAGNNALDLATYLGERSQRTGIYALDRSDLFNILCIPPDRPDDTDEATHAQVYRVALDYCVERRAMLIVDAPASWGTNATTASSRLPDLNITGPPARNAALYFPRVVASDPLNGDQLATFPACGAIAGIYARTDRVRGVWTSPAGLDARINGIVALQANLTDEENGLLNRLGINCLRWFPAAGGVVWGARTMRGADQDADEFKYVAVRRLTLFIEESLDRGLQWVIFEPNDEPLWAEIRLHVGSFMHNLFRDGAFQGSTPRDAYFVRCDRATMTQADIDAGIVNVVVGFAPLKPSEFVVITIQQLARGDDD